MSLVRIDNYLAIESNRVVCVKAINNMAGVAVVTGIYVDEGGSQGLQRFTTAKSLEEVVNRLTRKR